MRVGILTCVATLTLAACGQTPQEVKSSESERFRVQQPTISAKPNLELLPQYLRVAPIPKELEKKVRTEDFHALAAEDKKNVEAIYRLNREQGKKIQALVDRAFKDKKLVTEIPEAVEQIEALVSENRKQIENDLNTQSYGDISVDEYGACAAVGLTACSVARQASYKATDDTYARFWWQPHEDGNEGNAYKHSYWNALMTRSIGVGAAKTIADAHETGNRSARGYGTIWGDADLYNNDVGRQYGYSYRYSGTDRDVGNALYNADYYGVLQIIEKHWQNWIVWSNAYTPWPD